MTNMLQITSVFEADPETGETWEAIEVRNAEGELLSVTLE